MVEAMNTPQYFIIAALILIIAPVFILLFGFLLDVARSVRGYFLRQQLDTELMDQYARQQETLRRNTGEVQ